MQVEKAEMSGVLLAQASAPSASVSPTAELFSRGDYATVALHGEDHSWQTHAARGLIGKTREALDGLSRFDHEQAVFFSAVSHWIGGEDDDAVRLLTRLSSPHAQNLLQLIRKPKIQVLAQLPWRREGCADLLTGAKTDPHFHVANISFHPQDRPNKPYADIHEFYTADETPDFYICAMVEWHLVPPKLQQLPCPIFGHTADYDLHIQTVYPWLSLFDALLVTDGSEWRDVSRLVRSPVFTFPKSFGVPNNLPPLPQGERDIDVYLSGTLLHPYHPDKAKLFHQLLDMGDLRIKVINGFKMSGEYYDDLARSKICISYVRHPTALPTRALEALAMGCALVVQQDSVLTLFAGAEQGVLTYQLDRNDMPAAVRQIVQRWPDFARRAQAGARRVREQFSQARTASQYLRFLTYLAARPHGPRSYHTEERLVQKRCVLQKGWLFDDDVWQSPLLRSIAIRNAQQFQAAATPESRSPHALIDLARESVLTNYHRAEIHLVPMQHWLAYLHNVYRTAWQRFPRSLVARFNAIRILLHLGTPELVAEALGLLDETIALPSDHWQIDVMEDVFPWDFYPQFFNYRGYFDRITSHLMQHDAVEADLCRLILASLHAYRGFYPTKYSFHSQSLDDYRMAVALDPEFPYYKLWYARQLLERGLGEDRQNACRLLRELAGGSLIFQEAYATLKELDGERDELERRTARAAEILDVRESIEVPRLQEDLRRLERIQEEQLHAMKETWRAEREHLYQHIHAIESSKFWKLRQAWFGVKRWLHLTRR